MAAFRVAIGGFQYETNTFSAKHRADYQYFLEERDRPPLTRCAEILTRLAGTTFAIAGFMQDIDKGHDLVPLVWSSGGAGGLVTDDAFERIAAELVGRLSQAGAVHAIYLDLHGAMVTASLQDGEGELLRRVRACVGDDVPIVVSLDYHANVTPQMLELTDGIVAFKTYPHVDRVDTGRRAARLVERLLRKGRPSGRSLRHASFLIPLESQSTLAEPSRSIVGLSRCDEAGLVSLSYLAGFPPADTFWSGPSVVAHADSQALAEQATLAMLEVLERREAEFAARLWGVKDGVAEAMRMADRAERPVVVADIQDNPGAGGTGDTTDLLKALVSAGAQDAIVGFLHDPAAASAACAAGRGGKVVLSLGGHHGPAGVTPMVAEFQVEQIAEGPFLATGKINGGNRTDLGLMARISLGGVEVVVTSKRIQALDPAPFLQLGVDPAKKKIVVLKSTCHFRADFEAMAEAVLLVAAPGAYVADPSSLAYLRLRPTVRLAPRCPQR
jgi:microcystin degradation protein MlrC